MRLVCMCVQCSVGAVYQYNIINRSTVIDGKTRERKTPPTARIIIIIAIARRYYNIIGVLYTTPTHIPNSTYR